MAKKTSTYKKKEKNENTFFRFNKVSNSVWQLVQYKDGKEEILFSDHHAVVFGKFKRILKAQPLEKKKEEPKKETIDD